MIFGYKSPHNRTKPADLNKTQSCLFFHGASVKSTKIKNNQVKRKNQGYNNNNVLHL